MVVAMAMATSLSWVMMHPGKTQPTPYFLPLSAHITRPHPTVIFLESVNGGAMLYPMSLVFKMYSF